MTFALRDTQYRAVSDGEYRATIACGPLLPRVLDRLLGALAARGDLSVDRLNDLALVGDAVSAAAAESRGRRAARGRSRRPGEGALELELRPVRPGRRGARAAGRRPAGRRRPLRGRRASEVDVVASDGGAERLTLRIGR